MLTGKGEYCQRKRKVLWGVWDPAFWDKVKKEDRYLKARKCPNKNEHHGSDKTNRSLWRTSGLLAFNNAVLPACLTALAHVFTRKKKAFHLIEIR